jgi:hypothetical protein
VGAVFGANAPVWTSNNGTNTSSLYDGNGTNEKLLVALPANTGGTPFQPTGIVSFDPTNFPNDFVVTAAGKSGPSSFIYSGLARRESGRSRGRQGGRSLDRLRAWALETERRRGHNKATVALANKIARIVWATWKHQRSFDRNWSS